MDLYERHLLTLHEELSGRGVRSVLHTHGILWGSITGSRLVGLVGWDHH